MPAFQLHLVTEPRASTADLLDRLTSAVAGGVDWVQLRDKSASAASLHALGTQALALVHQHGARLSVNDRLDVALAIGADGVHLAGQSLPVADAVRLAAGRLLVGRSVHAEAEAVAAAAAGVDYVTFGHVFPTSSHPGLPPHGLDELRRVVAAVGVPVIAIGGITPENMDMVLATGCAGIAVISAILGQANPKEAAARLRERLDRTTEQPRHPLRKGPDAAHRQPTTV